MNLNWTVTLQIGANKSKTINVVASNQIIAWRKATEKQVGVVIDIHLAPKQ